MSPPRQTANFPEFVFIWTKLQGMEMPKLHVRMARWLAARWRAGDRELLLMAFRNSGKSTLVGLFCAWMLSRDPDLRILVLAADLALARKMVRNVKRILERHPLTKGLKPKRADQWASDQFTVNRPGELRDPSMLAKGIGANVTGSRADVVICDDVEVPNTCDTPPKRLDLRERLDEIDYVLVPGGLQLYVGTPHTYYTIYGDQVRPESGETQPYLTGFKRLEIPLLDSKGRSRWPERFPPERVAGIRRRTGKNKFESQMMLRPVNLADGRLDPDHLRVHDHDLVYGEGNGESLLTLNGKRLVSASCWWDPAYGSPDKGDGSVIACLFTDEDGMYWLQGLEYIQHDPTILDQTDEATQQCRKVVAFARQYHLPAVTLETNGLGRFLPGLLRRELTQAGLACAVIEAASKRNKEMRIIDAFDAVLAAGNLSVHRQVWSTPFIAEMREWRPTTKGRDDGLDAVSGCLLAEPVRLTGRLPADPNDLQSHAAWRRGGGQFDGSTEFDP
ncbi:phage terminase large subunit [Magnetospira sp. QH-2]|uniref:phage terminase large subunit n=1 Tax=Magnetospira sp. (strain QH-2) TaxID=1288970 RepID=UPI0003E80EE2|nr:phage terminase large subunit [Magnetospira sp. QH-2]CCQ72318.1 Putative DNA maturase B from Bacteriophage T3 [Magnetospira sp. QH-2]